ncbi:MAG: cryptochrome/photolyase family protein [Phycisphaerales bacterium]|nr:cryptochrome/photolyase family protein [Phycisphaerales bacterium]
MDPASAVLRDIDAARDVVLMMEVAAESRHVPSHVQRTVVFLSAMRHFAGELVAKGLRVRYVSLADAANTQTFEGELSRAVRDLKPEAIVVLEPGEHRVRVALQEAADGLGVPLEVRADEHFLTPREVFAAHASSRKSLIMEFFYREQRKRLDVLMERGKPVGGDWNFDKENRESFGRDGPHAPAVLRFEPDAITCGVMEDVRRVLPELPGRIESFGWAVTRAQALESLQDFVEHRLDDFGPYEDAMWTGQTWLYHSQLSVPLNLKLISPRECVEAALARHARRPVPLASLEGFVRQIIGWREFIRGVYFHEGPSYETRNYLEEHGMLPSFYWDGKTEMKCLRECVGQVLDHAYTHHIPRLMVLANFALISGVHPKKISDWFLAMFADAVDWVTLPNTLGMAMHADGVTAEQATKKQPSKGPVVGTKPYAASGKYISRMSNYCRHCAFDVEKRTGDDACPFNTFYWDFLIRNKDRFKGNQRMVMVMKNVERLSRPDVVEITVSAKKLREKLGIGAIGGT